MQRCPTRSRPAPRSPAVSALRRRLLVTRTGSAARAKSAFPPLVSAPFPLLRIVETSSRRSLSPGRTAAPTLFAVCMIGSFLGNEFILSQNAYPTAHPLRHRSSFPGRSCCHHRAVAACPRLPARRKTAPHHHLVLPLLSSRRHLAFAAHLIPASIHQRCARTRSRRATRLARWSPRSWTRSGLTELADLAPVMLPTQL